MRGVLIGLLVCWGCAGVARTQEPVPNPVVPTFPAAPGSLVLPQPFPPAVAPGAGGGGVPGDEDARARGQDANEVERLQKQVELQRKQIEALQRTTQALADRAEKQPSPAELDV